MTTVSFEGTILKIDGRTVPMQYRIRDALDLGDRIVVLLDPDSYLTDPSYTRARRRGNDPVRNLIAVSDDGTLLWEAEFPEQVDYFYRILSTRPLIALSFSSFCCEIDPQTGLIIKKEFLK